MTLQLIGTPVDLPSIGASEEEAWLYTRPRRLQIVEMNATNPGPEIVFCTEHGRLVVMSRDFQILGEHSESGIVDFIVGPNGGTCLTGSAFDKQIHLLSARGHVITIQLDSGSVPDPKNRGRLCRASVLQYGGLCQISPITWSGQSRIAALFVNGPATVDSVRVFDPANLQPPVATFGRIDAPMYVTLEGDELTRNVGAPVDERGISMATATSGGSRYLVVLNNDHLITFDGAGNYAGVKDLGLLQGSQPVFPVFPAANMPLAVGACAVAAGNIDADTAEDEIIVSTMAGHVVWYKLSELTTPGLDSGVLRRFRVDRNPPAPWVVPIPYEDRANFSLAATWSLALKEDATPMELHAVDQTGSWWKIDPATGRPVTTAAARMVDWCASLRPSPRSRGSRGVARV